MKPTDFDEKGVAEERTCLEWGEGVPGVDWHSLWEQYGRLAERVKKKRVSRTEDPSDGKKTTVSMDRWDFIS